MSASRNQRPDTTNGSCDGYAAALDAKVKTLLQDVFATRLVCDTIVISDDDDDDDGIAISAISASDSSSDSNSNSNSESGGDVCAWRSAEPADQAAAAAQADSLVEYDTTLALASEPLVDSPSAAGAAAAAPKPPLEAGGSWSVEPGEIVESDGGEPRLNTRAHATVDRRQPQQRRQGLPDQVDSTGLVLEHIRFPGYEYERKDMEAALYQALRTLGRLKEFVLDRNRNLCFAIYMQPFDAEAALESFTHRVHPTVQADAKTASTRYLLRRMATSKSALNLKRLCSKYGVTYNSALGSWMRRYQDANTDHDTQLHIGLEIYRMRKILPGSQSNALSEFLCTLGSLETFYALWSIGECGAVFEASPSTGDLVASAELSSKAYPELFSEETAFRVVPVAAALQHIKTLAGAQRREQFYGKTRLMGRSIARHGKQQHRAWQQYQSRTASASLDSGPPAHPSMEPVEHLALDIGGLSEPASNRIMGNKAITDFLSTLGTLEDAHVDFRRGSCMAVFKPPFDARKIADDLASRRIAFPVNIKHGWLRFASTSREHGLDTIRLWKYHHLRAVEAMKACRDGDSSPGQHGRDDDDDADGAEVADGDGDHDDSHDEDDDGEEGEEEEEEEEDGRCHKKRRE